MKSKRALISGVTGQDGSFMAKLLLKKNYIVHGLIRKSATGNLKNVHIITCRTCRGERTYRTVKKLFDNFSVKNKPIITKFAPKYPKIRHNGTLMVPIHPQWS